jgi:hypothetical protein
MNFYRYRDAPNDPVPQIVGLRGVSSPLNILRSILSVPCALFCSPEDSPHTLPYKWDHLTPE